jgi:hypothetical protein
LDGGHGPVVAEAVEAMKQSAKEVEQQATADEFLLE